MEAAQACLSLFVSKCHIVGNLMSRLILSLCKDKLPHCPTLPGHDVNIQWGSTKTMGKHKKLCPKYEVNEGSDQPVY